MLVDLFFPVFSSDTIYPPVFLPPDHFRPNGSFDDLILPNGPHLTVLTGYGRSMEKV
jgi:hypothetical protein